MLVKIDDTATATEYGVEDTPALVYFENEVPHLYEGKKIFHKSFKQLRLL